MKRAVLLSTKASPPSMVWARLVLAGGGTGASGAGKGAGDASVASSPKTF